MFAPLVQYGPVRLILLIALVGYVAWFWYRAGSVFIILERLSRLISKRGFHDKALEAQWLEAHDVERFRFIFNIKAYTRSDLKKLGTWAERNDVGMQQISAMRRWIDIRSAEVLQQPPKKYVFWQMQKFFACMVVMFIALPLINFGSALLVTNTSHRFILAGPHGIQPLSPFESWNVTKSVCDAGLPGVETATGFTNSEATALCGLISDTTGQGAAFISNAVNQQLFAAALIDVPVFILGFVMGRRMSAASQAIELKKQLDSRAAAPPPPAMPAPAKKAARRRPPRNNAGPKDPGTPQTAS